MKKTNFRWFICAMLFLATTINYLDRQVLSLTWKDFIAPDFQWSDSDYGIITAVFSLFYAFISLFAGRFIDWMGTRKGYVWAIIVWSLGACMHAACGWAALQLSAPLGLTITTASVWMFLVCRVVLATGEAGNFPAAIKVTAEYFPKKDRALATSIFNAGASVGALAAPVTIPVLAVKMGWEMAFIIIGVAGFVWAGLWLVFYARPRNSKYVNEAELAYIRQDDVAEQVADAADAEQTAQADTAERGVSIDKVLTYRQAWAFIMGKFCTDGVWWFLLFWAPAYFSELGYPSSSTMGQLLIFVLYLIVTSVSILGGYLPKFFVERLGLQNYTGRMRAMLIFAFLPVFAMFAQPLADVSPWWPCVLIGLAGAGHQAWSANLYSTIGDMFPRSAIATITGIGTMAGGLCSFAICQCSGMLFDYAAAQGEAFSFFSVTGKPAAYMMVFCYCAVAYLIAWCVIKALVPKYSPAEI
ncbi:MAG: MFS transporter [Bacteroidaceae bacterium]|nr:MFS transporter [Bacteroidaceae bacterium]